MPLYFIVTFSLIRLRSFFFEESLSWIVFICFDVFVDIIISQLFDQR